MQESNEKTLNEWKVAMENARHFNDLLIRFRMLGLPMVTTLSVAAIASGQFVTEIEMWKWVIPVIALCISISALTALSWHTIQKLRFSYKKAENKKEHEIKQEPPLPIYWFEFILWAIFVLIISIFSAVNIYDLVSSKESLAFSNTATYSLVPIGLIVAVVLLIALYTMDRFYYYKLLIGAVSRLVVLEKSLGFKITDTTSEFVPRKYATNIITFFYSLPGIVLLIISCVSLYL
jgi:uncharacterized membrane protein